MEQIVQIISTLGFPIFCAIALGYVGYKFLQESRADNLRREDRLFSQLEKFGESLDNFNTTLIKIDARLEAVEEKINKS